MKCSQIISKEKLRIIAGSVVLIITVLAVSLVVIFEIANLRIRKVGTYIYSGGKHMN